jgi:hypothetical protein
MKNFRLKLLIVLIINFWFLLASSAVIRAANFSFISFTDSHGSTSLDNLMTKAKALNPAFGIFCGDMENNGVTSTEMNSWLDEMRVGNMLDITFPVRGNHDNYQSNSLGLWDQYFDNHQTAASINATNYTSLSGYNDAVYSFDYANSHIVGLDVPGNVYIITSAELTWLDNDLGQAENRGLTHAFIFFHGPVYCFGGGSDHCSCTTRTCLDNATTINNIISVLNKHSIVTATFHGHEHMYAYSKIDSSRISLVTHPYYQFISGNAGGDNRNCNANRCDYESTGHGFVFVSVENEKVTVQWYNNGNSPAVNTVTFNNVSGNTSSTPVPSPTSYQIPTPVNCPSGSTGNLNCDSGGLVNETDLSILLNKWAPNGPVPTPGANQFTADLNGDGRVDETDLARLLSNWKTQQTISPTPIVTPTVSPGGSGLDLYGVKFAHHADFAYLASLGVMNPVTDVHSNSEIDPEITAAREVRKTYPKFKPILWMYPEGWSCSGINSTGTSFVNYLNTKNYWDDILAIYGLHEPLGSIKCASLDEVVNIHNQIRQLSGGKAKIFGKMYSDVSYQNMGFKDGICDYCGVMYHPYRQNDSTSLRSVTESCPASGPCYRKNEMLKNLERDLTIFKSVTPGVTMNKFNPYLGIIEWPDSGVYGTGQYMPGPAEMLDGGSAIVNFVNTHGYRVDGLIWYTYENNSSWIGLKEYNGDGLHDARMETVRQAGALR